MMRVSPALRWDYGAVWAFLRGAALPFCGLYRAGYTSLGVRSTSVPNPALALAGGGFKPAWELGDGGQERAGRGARGKAAAGAARGEGAAAAEAPASS